MIEVLEFNVIPSLRALLHKVFPKLIKAEQIWSVSMVLVDGVELATGTIIRTSTGQKLMVNRVYNGMHTLKTLKKEVKVHIPESITIMPWKYLPANFGMKIDK